MRHQFHLARWVVALFAVGFFGGGTITILGVADILQEYDANPMGTLLRIALIGGGLVCLVVVPSGYYLIRRTRGIPILSIDPRGVVLGGSWEEDLAVEWRNVSQVALRQTTADGIRDTQVIFTLVDEAPLRLRIRNLRQRLTVQLNRLMFGSPFGLSTAYVAGGSDAVLSALARSYPGELKLMG